LRDPDKTAHRHIAEDGPSYRQPAYGASRELPDRYARGGRCCTRHDLIELPRVDVRPGIAGGADSVAVAGTELDAQETRAEVDRSCARGGTWPPSRFGTSGSCSGGSRRRWRYHSFVSANMGA
jgi:hypothetical protein